MKLLTLNTHSLIEENYPQKLLSFADFVLREMPDVIALQEVNQSVCAQEVSDSPLPGYVPCAENRIPLRRDNHALAVSNLLNQQETLYHWTWLPAKIGYEKYDEGMAIFTRKPIQNTDNLLVSQSDNYAYWKTRRVLGVQVENQWYYSIHMGWWNDAEEPFEAQWKKLHSQVQSLESVWLMGDFNTDARVSREGFDLIRSDGWFDTYQLSEAKDDGYTVIEPIDGWRDPADTTNQRRIDYVWHNQNVTISRSQVVFDGKNSPKVSDHFGILVTLA